MNMPFLKDIPPFIFFTGKGGVGKTSLACATAVWLADQGKRTLLVSTDPASNVGQVFCQTIGHRITDISTVEILPRWKLIRWLQHRLIVTEYSTRFAG